jgi:S-adenosylmethionine hydrolase
MNKILVFQSDFGVIEGTVAQMYGVALSIDPTLKLLDITHNVPQFDTWSASHDLYQTIRFWPEGTVFVSVVDPGVGSNRQSVVAKTALNHYIVTPNNGTLTHVAKHIGITELRVIDETKFRRPGSEHIHIFHGRDVYAYTGAYLASGKARFEEIGNELPLASVVSHELIDPIISDRNLQGIIEIDDPHFGMVWTNIPSDALFRMGVNYGDTLNIEIKHEDVIKYFHAIPLAKSFAYVDKGDDLVYVNEMGNLAIATNLENFTQKRGIGFGSDWKVTISPKSQE